MEVPSLDKASNKAAGESQGERNRETIGERGLGETSLFIQNGKTSLERAPRTLTSTPLLRQKQVSDHHLGNVYNALHNKLSNAEIVEAFERYSVDDQDLIWFTSDAAKRPVLAIPRCMVAEILALVHI